MKDLISQLPNDLLHKILLNLKTDESVKTSVLSSRWRYLWQNVPGLMFDGGECDVKDFLDRFLNLHKELTIYQFTLKCSVVDIPCLKLFIDQVLIRGVQCLKINGSRIVHRGLRMIKLPVSVYTCETLVSLHLMYVKLDDFDGSEFINLPHLQVLHLCYVSIPSDVVLDMLISCSLVLQELNLSNIEVRHVKVRSQTLRRLSLSMIYNNEGESRVVIDTPNLEFLCISFDQVQDFRVESVSVGSSLKICIRFYIMYRNHDFSNMQLKGSRTQGLRCNIGDLNLGKQPQEKEDKPLDKVFLFGPGWACSYVTDLSIFHRTLEGIYHTYHKVLQHHQISKFKNLTRLYACFYASFSEMVPLFLSGCPNLKSIILEFRGSPKMDEIANLPVPQCLQTSIEIVQIKIVPMAHQERNQEAETEFVKYILKNAKALKKLTLCLDEEGDVCKIVLEQILTFRNSPFVEVKIRRATSNHRLGYVF